VKKAPVKKVKAVAKPAPVERDELVMAEVEYEEEPLPLSMAEETNKANGRRLNDVRGGGLTIKKADFTVNSLMDKIRRGEHRVTLRACWVALRASWVSMRA
jgi:hypothetical protein